MDINEDLDINEESDINQDQDIDENQDDTLDNTPIPPKSVKQIKNDILNFIENAKNDYGIEANKLFYEICSYYQYKNDNEKIYLLDKTFARFDYNNEDDENDIYDINDINGSFNSMTKRNIFQNKNYKEEVIFLNKRKLKKFICVLKKLQEENEEEFKGIAITNDEKKKLIFIIRCGNEVVSYIIKKLYSIWDEIIKKYFICVNIIESD